MAAKIDAMIGMMIPTFAAALSFFSSCTSGSMVTVIVRRVDVVVSGARVSTVLVDDVVTRSNVGLTVVAFVVPSTVTVRRVVVTGAAEDGTTVDSTWEVVDFVVVADVRVVVDGFVVEVGDDVVGAAEVVVTFVEVEVVVTGFGVDGWTDDVVGLAVVDSTTGAAEVVGSADVEGSLTTVVRSVEVERIVVVERMVVTSGAGSDVVGSSSRVTNTVSGASSTTASEVVSEVVSSTGVGSSSRVTYTVSGVGACSETVGSSTTDVSEVVGSATEGSLVEGSVVEGSTSGSTVGSSEVEGSAEVVGVFMGWPPYCSRLYA